MSTIDFNADKVIPGMIQWNCMLNFNLLHFYPSDDSGHV